MDKKTQINFWYVIAAVLGILFGPNLYVQSTKPAAIPYSKFQALLDADKVAQIAISQNQINGTLKEALPDGSKDFTTTRVDPDLAAKLD